MGRKAVSSNQVFIDGLRVPSNHRTSARRPRLQIHPARHEPERVLIAGEAIGLGRKALKSRCSMQGA